MVINLLNHDYSTFPVTKPKTMVHFHKVTHFCCISKSDTADKLFLRRTEMILVWNDIIKTPLHTLENKGSQNVFVRLYGSTKPFCSLEEMLWKNSFLTFIFKGV